MRQPDVRKGLVYALTGTLVALGATACSASEQSTKTAKNCYMFTVGRDGSTDILPALQNVLTSYATGVTKDSLSPSNEQTVAMAIYESLQSERQERHMSGLTPGQFDIISTCATTTLDEDGRATNVTLAEGPFNVPVDQRSTLPSRFDTAEQDGYIFDIGSKSVNGYTAATVPAEPVYKN